MQVLWRKSRLRALGLTGFIDFYRGIFRGGSLFEDTMITGKRR